MRVAGYRCGGFSLAELLTVLGIIGILVTLAVPALRGVSETGSMTQAVTRISGTLDVARAYAVANNTHSWVAFTDNPLAIDSTVKMVAFASRGGQDLDPDNTGNTIDYSSGGVELIAPIETMRQMRLDGTIPEDNALLDAGALPQASALEEFPIGTKGLQLRLQEQTYTRSIHFTPSGEASITEELPEVIQMVVIPDRNPGGTPSEKDRRQAMVIRVSGLTGQAIVYQPR